MDGFICEFICGFTIWLVSCCKPLSNARRELSGASERVATCREYGKVQALFIAPRHGVGYMDAGNAFVILPQRKTQGAAVLL